MFRLKGTAGPGINQSHELKRSLSIGQGADCDIQAGNTPASGRLAEVLLEDNGRVLLRGLSPDADLRVNGNPVSEARLAPGDEIRCGRSAFLLQAPGLRPERVLSENDAVPGRRVAPWLIAALAVAGVAALAWRLGWLAI